MAPKNIGEQIVTRLSVNVNKIATLRNARGENTPDVLKIALLIEELGADGITVHPRPDERHIKKNDVYQLKKHLTKELNIEGYPSKAFIALVNEVRPAQVTFVPDPPHVITSNAGFKLRDDLALVQEAIDQVKGSGARVSIFIDPKDFTSSIDKIKESGTDRIELYTKSYADNPGEKTLAPYKKVALMCKDAGIGINAGHDLSLDNLAYLLKNIPFINEVSIGHALISEAIILGMPETIRKYKMLL